MEMLAARNLYCGRRILATILLVHLFSAVDLNAQIYPADSATWCIFSTMSPNGAFFTYSFIPGDDTLINGRAYDVVRLTSGNTFLEPEFYVRNDSLGNGMVYSVSDGQEFLSADLSAQAGDTVHDVLVYNLVGGSGGCSLGSDLITIDVVVDSVVQFVLANTQAVKRFYVSSACYNAGFFFPDKFFWQEHAGTSMGAVMTISDQLASIQPQCFVAGGTITYSSTGFVCACDLSSSIDEFIEQDVLGLSPNPIKASEILFLNKNFDKVQVYTASGKKISEHSKVSSIRAPDAAGIYMISGIYGGRIAAAKLIVP